MRKIEGINVEYKKIYIPEIKKEIVAFANSEGGTIYIGIDDQGLIQGIDNPDEIMLKLASSIRDSIKPDIIPFVRIDIVKHDSKNIIKIEVEVGTNRPYYLSDKGLKPSGVYVRKGSASQPLSDEGIRKLIIENSGYAYESARSINQDLTFDYFYKEMVKKGVEYDKAKLQTLQIIGTDGLYTNLGLLLSDQCEHSIKIALFEGDDKEIFRDRREIKGSILKQLEETYHFIEMNNHTKAMFNGLTRIDNLDYPQETIREALLNCIVHRDYSFSGSNLINIYNDRIEFISLGSIVSGLSMESILLGVSQSRNTKLADILYRMRLIESYGTGIAKIKRLYKNERKQPIFETAQGVFKVILFNRNYENKILTLNVAEENVMDYVIKHDFITRKQVEEILDVKTTKAYNVLKKLCEDGKILAEGKGKQKIYKVNK